MDQSILSLITNLIARPTLDEETRKLRGQVKYNSARIDDLEIAKMNAERGKKRKRDDDLCKHIAQGRGLIMEAQSLLSQLEEGSPEQRRRACGGGVLSFLGMYANIIAVQRSLATMAAHDWDGDVLLTDGQAGNGLNIGNQIPAKVLYGQVASTALFKLQALLMDPKLARMAIQGAEGLGKTLLMKHLYNYAVNALEAAGRFKYVFWASFPAQLSIGKVQDAVAGAVECDLSDIMDLIARARKLSSKLAALGEYVLFLDGVPDAKFSLEQIGIPAPSEGALSKLVISCRSDLVCSSLDCSEIVQVNPLPEEEAFGLFMHEAGIDLGHVYLLDDIPRLVAILCDGVPSMIAETANRMRNVYNICEWRNMLFELENRVV